MLRVIWSSDVTIAIFDWTNLWCLGINIRYFIFDIFHTSFGIRRWEIRQTTAITLADTRTTVWETVLQSSGSQTFLFCGPLNIHLSYSAVVPKFFYSTDINHFALNINQPLLPTHYTTQLNAVKAVFGFSVSCMFQWCQKSYLRRVWKPFLNLVLISTSTKKINTN